jgi:integrase
MRLTKRGNVWRVEFTDLSGARRRVSTEERDEAKAKVRALAIMQEALTQDLPSDDRRALASTLTLDYALQQSMDTRWRGQKQGKPIAYRVAALQEQVGHWRLAGIDYNRLAGYVKERKEAGDAPATIVHKLCTIRTAMKDAAMRGELTGIPPFPEVEVRNTKERYLSRAEEADVLAWIEQHEKDVIADERPMWRYMGYLVPLLLDTGLRLSEALGLDEGNVWQNQIVLRHGETKSDKGRAVPLTRRAQVALAGLLGHSLHGKVDANWAGRRWRTVTAGLGLDDATLHTLRHTCASRLVQAGMELYRVSKWLGHSSITVTERYAHLAPTALADGAALLEQGSVPQASEALQGWK